MKNLFRTELHKQSSSHDCQICEIKGKKVKMTYTATNAVEKCTTELFDGDKWNGILSLMDMGIEPESSAYNIWDAAKRKKRADHCFYTAQIMIEAIL